MMRPLVEALQNAEERCGADSAAPTLGVHKLTQDGQVKLTMIPCALNQVDLGTKHLDGSSLHRVPLLRS